MSEEHPAETVLTAKLLQEPERGFQNADWMHERLIEIIVDFELNLPGHMQAGGRLASFQDTTFSIDNIRHFNPDIIIFEGTLPNQTRVELIQHTSQLNVLLVAVPLSDSSAPRRKIGFAPRD